MTEPAAAHRHVRAIEGDSFVRVSPWWAPRRVYFVCTCGKRMERER